jgi:hypothetical protein
MKKFFKILLIVLVVLIILFLGLMAYLYFGKGGDRSTMNIIPSDAIFAIETTNLSKGWETISESNVWKHLAGNPYFGEINESLQEVDELLKDNKAVQILLEDRRLLLSTHMTSTSDYDFLFIIDLQKASKLSFLTNTIGILGYEVNKSKYEGIEILELIDKETEDKMYLGIIDNLLVGSFDNRLLEKAIAMKNNKFWTENTKFLQVASEISNTSLLRFYFNYSQLDNFMKAYLAHENESISSISKSLAYSAFELDFQNDELNFTGHTNMDTASSYIKALSKVKPGRMKAFDVISDQAAFYMAMCFENYLDFYDRLKKEFSYENINESENFDKNVRKLEKYLNINLHDDFFSWIGSEIAFIKLRPSQNSRAEDIVVAIHANNISKAKSGLQHIITQVGKKSPMHFDVSTYKNFDINYLNIKGFFKLILGKLFGKLEKPYFTYINDFVIFSNSKSTLEDVISGYVSGKTLSHSQEFMDFIDRFESKSNASIFVQMPKMYSNLYYFTKDDTKKSMQENRELILSFSKIGLQLVSQGELLEAKMIALHDSTALLTDAIEKLEYQTAENLFVNEYESLSFKITLEDDVSEKCLERICHSET